MAFSFHQTGKVEGSISNLVYSKPSCKVFFSQLWYINWFVHKSSHERISLKSVVEDVQWALDFQSGTAAKYILK